MSHQFDPNTSHSRIRRYTSQVIGGLQARPSLAAEVPPWIALRARVVAERGEREAKDDAVLVASASVRVADAECDHGLGQVSGEAYLASGKKATQDPYVTLFGPIDAARAKKLGVAKATEVGTRIVRDGRRFGVPALSASLDALDASVVGLTAAGEGLASAEDGLFAPRQAKKKLVRDLNALIAVTEARILTAFPGRDDLARAILQPWYLTRARPASVEDESDTSAPAPDLDEDDEATPS